MSYLDSKIHKQRLPAGLVMSGPILKATKWLSMAIGYRLFPCDPCRGLHATQMLEIKLPRLDAMRCTWCVPTWDPSW